tara:strand:+ start:265 stop:1488 length:1224 start_codon:yes stop_codon:yes gene_type:complete
MPRTSGYKNRGKNNPNSYRNQTTKTTTNTPPTTTSVQDNKPVYNKKFSRSQSANAGMNNRMSYPIKDSPSERTGDRLLIRCLQFEPPKDGAGLSVTLTNAYKTDGTNRSVISMRDRQRIKEGTLEVIGENGSPMSGNEPIGVSVNNTDANTRLGSGMKQRTKFYIELPIPQDLTDSNSVTWGEDRVNALELAALNVAQGAMKGNIGEGAVEAAQLAVTALNTGVNIPTLSGDTQDAVRAALSGAAIGALGSNVSAKSVIARSTGQILNNNLELLFQGVNLRSFPYSITFSPRDPNESRMVKDIIRSLKMAMAPKAGEMESSAQGIFLKSPDVFQLKYLRDGHDHPFLNSFKLCALTGMTVNYTNAGTYTSYEDGTPVNIRMNLTFKELNPIYHEDYLSDGAGSGVGY